MGEFNTNGIRNDLSHTRGAISMARASDPDSASSQFFIVHQDSTYLDGQYACFGYVTDGMDIVDEICENTPGRGQQWHRTAGKPAGDRAHHDPGLSKAPSIANPAHEGFRVRDFFMWCARGARF